LNIFSNQLNTKIGQHFFTFLAGHIFGINGLSKQTTDGTFFGQLDTNMILPNNFGGFFMD
jgi:hypothetical protein